MNGWFHNGERASAVPIGDRAFQYGDGLFETVAIRDGEPRLWSLHEARLAAGCRRLAIRRPDKTHLHELIGSALAQCDFDTARCTAKIIVSSGVSKRGYARPAATPDVFVGIFPSEPLPDDCYRTGVETIVCDTRLALFSPTAGLKTLNRLEQVLAAAECRGAGAFEGLTLDAEGRLICGTMSNVFLVSDSSIVTPSLSRCGVAGVMRQHTMDVLRMNGTPVTVRDVSRDEIFQSDEIFLSNSQFGILPVRRCGDKALGPAALTQKIMTIMAANGVSDCAL